jgi:peptidoglycan/xylan/chitin deacetylase (PgdA/CDA1 family)
MAMAERSGFWPGGTRLAVSVSMQFEAGGQPASGASGPITEPVLPGFPDLGQNTFYEYGAREGVSRILDLLDAHGITMTSFMIGDAVRRHPEVAAEIVRRGHEAGAHGRSWQRQYHLARPQEKEWIADSVTAIEQATGTRPLGYNNYWIRPGVNTLEILQELGFTYHIDDLSANEPFLQLINGKPFATVPYTVHLNDISSFDFPGFNPSRLPAAADRRVRPAVRRGRWTAPDDGDRLARAHLRACLPGPRAGPDIHPAALPRGRVVGAQGPDRPVGPGPPRHRRLGRPSPGPCQRPARAQRLSGGVPRPAAAPARKEGTWKPTARSTPRNSCAISPICETALTAAPVPAVALPGTDEHVHREQDD